MMRDAVQVPKLIWALTPTVATLAIAYVAGKRTARWLPRLDLAFIRLLGMALILLGVALRIWATLEFWMRGRGTPLPPLEPKRLVVTGPYRYSRNPLYLGKLVITGGIGMFLGSSVVVEAVPIWWALLQFVLVPWEESELYRRFGEAYTNYMTETPRWMPILGFNKASNHIPKMI